MSAGTLQAIQNKINRRPEYIQSDAQTLAACGLEFERVCDHFHTLKKIQEPDRPSDFASEVKSWAVDRMMEALFEGQNSNQHKLALAFWKKSGKGLINA